jgi:hypothetical protein
MSAECQSGDARATGVRHSGETAAWIRVVEGVTFDWPATVASHRRAGPVGPDSSVEPGTWTTADDPAGADGGAAGAG